MRKLFIALLLAQVALLLAGDLPERPFIEADALLDVAARGYLPVDSEAWRETRGGGLVSHVDLSSPGSRRRQAGGRGGTGPAGTLAD